MEPRKAIIDLTYQGVNISRDIEPFLLSFSYTDSGNGRADDLQISLADVDGRWRKSWFPRRGDRIKASIQLRNWYSSGTTRTLYCGTFDVDSVDYTGPDDTITIQAASYPGNTKIKSEPRSQSWEKVTLRQIAGQIAKRAGLKLMYEMDEVVYDRIDQSQETDLAFLSSRVEAEGGSLKITSGRLVLFDDRKYEGVKPTRTIERGKSDILSYSFNLQTTDAAYASCEIKFTDTSKKKTIKGSFSIPGAKGPVLKLNERVVSVAEATRKARAALRKANKDAQRAQLVLMGDCALVQGVTVKLLGFGGYDDTYYVETATHTVDGSGGYQTRIDLRKVLGY